MADARGVTAAWGTAAAELGAYALAAIWLTWPLATEAGSRVSVLCTVDAQHGFWALAWAARALGSDPRQLFDAPFLYPTPGAFFFAPNGLGSVAVFAPVFWLSDNPLLAFNVSLLAGVTLPAWGLHRLVRVWTGASLAGVIAGATFLLSPQWTRYLTMFPTYLSVYFMPWVIALAAAPPRRAWSVIGRALLIAAACATDPVYIAPAVVGPLLVIGAGRLVARRPAAGGLLAALGLALLVLSPLYRGYLAARAQTFTRGASAGGPLWPTVAEPLTLPWQPEFAPVPYATLLCIALGAVVLLVRGTWRDGVVARAWRHATVWVMVGVLIAAVNPLHRLVDGLLPGALDLLRGLQRLSLGLTMGAAVLAGLGFAQIAALCGGRRVAIGLATLVVAAMYGDWRAQMLEVGYYARTPEGRVRYGLQAMPTTSAAVLQALRRTPGPLVEVPAIHPVGAFASYRAIAHRRPILNGFASHLPRDHSRRMALVATLPDRAALARLVAETGLRSIIVRTTLLPDRGAAWAAVRATPTTVPELVFVAQDGGDWLFEVVGAE